MKNFLDKIILDNIDKRNLLLLEDKVKSFLEEKSILLKENPLEWEKLDNRIIDTSVKQDFKLLSVCPFSYKLFLIDCYYDNYQILIKLTIDNKLLHTFSEDGIPTKKNEKYILVEEKVFEEYLNKVKILAEKLR